MTKIKNLFNRVMDKDTNSAFVKNGFTRQVENLRFHTNDGDDGIGNNIKGSLKVSDSTDDRTDLKCVTAIHNEDLDVIYYYLASSSGQFSKIVEYDINSGNTVDVLHDTNGVLNLDKDGYITGINEIDGLLYWSEWNRNPRRINVKRAKTYGTDGFTEDDIKVIVKPPLQKLKITLETADTETQKENNIEDKFLYFSYRYRYLDGERSVLAPFTKAGFEPKLFSYDFSEQSNRSMINKFNQIKIDFNTGSERVVEIQLVFKESESNAVWIIDDFNKALMGYGNDEIQSFSFTNSKVYRALSSTVLPQLYDNVPQTSKSQEIIDGRLLYAYYKENYDIKDAVDGEQILIDFSLELKALTNTVDKTIDIVDEDGNVTGTEIIQVGSKIPKRTAKSNRDIEVGVVYGDDDGRITTILNSKTNTLYIPNENSVTENSIDVILKNKPPFWAKYFRFFIKQNKKTYDQILPSLFYEDGAYRWIKLEGADKDKVKEGDYLIVKSDTQRILSDLIKVKVLEVKSQEKNFLQVDSLDDEIVERAGLYFKIKPKGFRVDLDDYENYNLHTYDNTRNAYNDPIDVIDSYISASHFYGDTLNDLSSNSPFSGGAGTYTAGNDERNRYLIEIVSLGATDKFRWSDDDGANWFGGGAGTEIDITAGVPQALNNGVEITFENATGHSILDEWIVNARGTWSTKNSGRAYGFFRTVTPKKSASESGLLIDKEDEIIQNGARVYLEYSEYGRGSDSFIIDNISSDKYDNIEEWFYKENILTQITSQCDLVFDDIHFMRGVLHPTGNATKIIQDDVNGTMTMCIRSVEHGTGTSRVKVRATSEIIQNESENYLLFETEPVDQPKDLYFEVGKNYKIINGFHTHITEGWETGLTNIPTDQSQTSTQDLRVKLDWFNAYSYGNAVESYKIRDEFNKKGLDVGVRVLTAIREVYKEVTRKADITWSDVYNDESDFNGLNNFNLSQVNFVKLDKEDGTIQKLHRQNGNIIVLQEDAIGIMPYNKTIINDVDGGRVVGIATNILNKNSYRPYASGKHGISLHPESFVRDGSRSYFTDQQRGDLIRLANNGISTINQNLFEHEFSNLMLANKNNKLVAGYDSKHGEYIVHLPSTQGVLAFKETAKGFPNYFTFEPDFVLNANNEFYGWKNGVMHKMNATNTRNEFFGIQYNSKIKFFANSDFSIEKVFHAMGIESTHAWLVNLKTKLTSRTIEKNCFVKKEDYWFSEIMGNTNGNTESSAIFGLGTFAIQDSEIITSRTFDSMSVGDEIISKQLTFAPNKIIEILPDKIILENTITTLPSFLMYKKNQNIDGSNIRGDVLEVEMINDSNEKVELRAVNFEVSKSNYS